MCGSWCRSGLSEGDFAEEGFFAFDDEAKFFGGVVVEFIFAVIGEDGRFFQTLLGFDVLQFEGAKFLERGQDKLFVPVFEEVHFERIFAEADFAAGKFDTFFLDELAFGFAFFFGPMFEDGFPGGDLFVDFMNGRLVGILQLRDGGVEFGFQFIALQSEFGDLGHDAFGIGEIFGGPGNGGGFGGGAFKDAEGFAERFNGSDGRFHIVVWNLSYLWGGFQKVLAKLEGIFGFVPAKPARPFFEGAFANIPGGQIGAGMESEAVHGAL
jgi:hypothetical protein